MTTPPLPKLICIVGPTASGKTAFSLRLAQQFNGYIISADSRQMYTGMDIGTAKVTPAEQAQIPHFLIDITPVDQPLALNEIQKQMYALIQTQKQAHSDQIPFLVGGTGLYVQAVIDHWLLPQGEPLHTQRNKWEQQSLDKLVQQLHALEPMASNLVDLKNKRRVIRALEVAQTHQGLKNVVHKRGPQLFDVLLLGLKLDMTELDRRINQRVDEQIQAGLVEEVKQLAQKYTWSLPAMSGIGYKEIGEFLQGNINLPQAIEQIKLHTRQYARRQMTWFKRDKRIHWLAPEKAATEARHLIQTFLA